MYRDKDLIFEECVRLVKKLFWMTAKDDTFLIYWEINQHFSILHHISLVPQELRRKISITSEISLRIDIQKRDIDLIGSDNMRKKWLFPELHWLWEFFEGKDRMNGKYCISIKHISDN